MGLRHLTLINGASVAYAAALFLALFFRVPGFILTFSLAMLLFEVLLLLACSYFTFLVCRSIQEKMGTRPVLQYIRPTKNLSPALLLFLSCVAMGCGIISLFVDAGFAGQATLLFCGQMGFVPLYVLFLVSGADRKEHLVSLAADIDAETKGSAPKTPLPSLQALKALCLNYLARKDYEAFGVCVGLLMSLTEKKKGKSLVILYRCLKEISLECLNDGRACSILAGALRANFDAVFSRGLLPQTRIACEFASFLAVRTEEEMNVASSAGFVPLIGKMQSSLISAKHSSSKKPIRVLSYLGERAVKKNYPTLLSEVFSALGEISTQCCESETMTHLEKANEALSRIASLSLSSGKKDLALRLITHFSRLSGESFRNPRFFAITWSICDCLGEVGMGAIKAHEESVIGPVAALLRRLGIQSIVRYLKGTNEDITPARYAIRKLKAMKRELEKERMNTAATEIERAIWDIADAARL